MGKKHEKLLLKILNKPADLTYSELKQFLSYYGYQELQGNGSRVRFVDKAGDMIRLHRPHGNNKHIDRGFIADLIKKFKEKGII